MKNYNWVIIMAFSMLFSCQKPEKSYFEISAGDKNFIDCPIQVPVSMVFQDVPNSFELFEARQKESVKVPYQLDNVSSGQVISFVMEGKLMQGESRKYYVVESRNTATNSALAIVQDEDILRITKGERPMLEYRKSELPAPDSVDRIFRRSAYIHPLYSPGGEVLTRIQPPDHYHHYGIWNPWTKTHINGKEIDYWNLGRGLGRVRTNAVVDTYSGPVFAHFTALQEHIAYDVLGMDSVVTMDEFWDVRYWNAATDEDRYLLDLTSTFRNVISDTILFDAYRYGGGIGYRATAKWNADNSSVLTSEGKTRDEADGTRAKWCIVEGVSAVDEGRSGVLFLSHPDNREYPEPMRVWPSGSQNGELFFEFCPIRHKEWNIVPGIDNILNYRMIVFDGKLTKEEAEMYWNSFTSHPTVKYIE